MLGGHYTYAEVPLGFWVRDLFGLARNHYDRLGHFAQGFVPAIVAREILLRKTPLKPGGWVFFLVTCDLPRDLGLLRVRRVVDGARLRRGGHGVSRHAGRRLGHAVGHVPLPRGRAHGAADAVARPRPGTRPARRLRKALLVLAALFAVAALAAAWLIRGTFPRMRGTVRVAGHAAPVRIETDSRGVPTIRARSVRRRACTASGTRTPATASGRWSSSVAWAREARRDPRGRARPGRPLPSDGRLPARGGGRRGPALSASARRAARSLRRRRQRVRRRGSARPIEFRILRVSPETWTPVDSLVWGKMMAWDLAGNARDEIRRARFVEAVGRRAARRSCFRWPAPTPTILTAGEWPELSTRNASAGPRTLGPRALGPARRAPSTRSRRWASRPARTSAATPGCWRARARRAESPSSPTIRTSASGRPSVWYLASIDAPGLRATGATLPGVPGVVIGHNDRIAWGITSLEPDVQDLFVEEVDPQDPSRYRHRGEWRRFDARRETIRVRGGADVVLTVRGSVHGPIVTDAADGRRPARVGRRARLDGSRRGRPERSRPSSRIETARDWNGVPRGRAPDPAAPAQNLLYADVDGHIGYAAVGGDARAAARRRAAPGVRARARTTGRDGSRATSSRSRSIRRAASS